MSTEVVVPAEIKEAAIRLREAEEATEAARQDAVAAVQKAYARGLSARQLSNKFGGPFSYLTTLKHVNEGLRDMTPDEQRHLAATADSLF